MPEFACMGHTWDEVHWSVYLADEFTVVVAVVLATLAVVGQLFR